MIKQSWIINEGEKDRILNLHKTATKNLYIIREQDENIIKFPLVKLGDKFNYGEYNSQSAKSGIENLKTKIEEFIEGSNSSHFTVNIFAGESQVTNPKGFEEKGSLALARAQSIKKYFEEIFPGLIKKGILSIKLPSIEEKTLTIGKTPYTKGDQNKPDLKEKYDQEQYVNFDISGDKIEKITPEICKTEPYSSSGGYIYADSDFTQILEWNVGKGSGKIYIDYDTVNMPDIIYFEYNGKIYGNTTFKGSKSDDYRIFLGTSLMAKYGTGKLPKQFGENKISKIGFDDDRLKRALPSMKTWGLSESFNNTFGEKSSLHNPNYMSAFKNFDNNGGVNRLLRELGSDFPWGIITSDIEPGYGKIGLTKVNGIDVIKIINVAPVGTTRWSLNIDCEE